LSQGRADRFASILEVSNIGFVSIDGVFGLGDDILASLDDDHSVLVFQLGLFDLSCQLVSERSAMTYDIVISRPDITPLLYTSNQNPQITFCH